MQPITTSFEAAQQAPAVFSTKVTLSQRAVEAVEAYLQCVSSLPVSSYPPLPVATSFLGKMRALLQ